MQTEIKHEHDPADQFCMCEKCIDRHLSDILWILTSPVGTTCSLYHQAQPLDADLKAEIEQIFRKAFAPKALPRSVDWLREREEQRIQAIMQGAVG